MDPPIKIQATIEGQLVSLLRRVNLHFILARKIYNYLPYSASTEGIKDFLTSTANAYFFRGLSGFYTLLDKKKAVISFFNTEFYKDKAFKYKLDNIKAKFIKAGLSKDRCNLGDHSNIDLILPGGLPNYADVELIGKINLAKLNEVEDLLNELKDLSFSYKIGAAQHIEMSSHISGLEEILEFIK